jgi:hypothetical protein
MKSHFIPRCYLSLSETCCDFKLCASHFVEYPLRRKRKREQNTYNHLYKLLYRLGLDAIQLNANMSYPAEFEDEYEGGTERHISGLETIMTGSDDDDDDKRRRTPRIKVGQRSG